MQLTSFGAAQEVTGSKHLLEIGDRRVLLDFGMFQGKRQESDAKNRKIPFDVSSIDALVLSHAHIDHSGLLPLLHKRGYEGPIYATPATVDLCSYMLKDSAFIQERDTEWLAKKKKKFIPPLYTIKDAESTLNLFKPIPYYKKTEILPGIHLTYLNAGHILGSAMVFIEARENDQDHTFLFSGDLGRKNLPILKDPDTPPAADTVLMESTYGNRDHDDLKDLEERVRVIIQKTYDRGGKIIIPSFALERAQEVVFTLKRLELRGELPNIPVFVDSPLAVNVTEVFRKHPDCFDEDVQEVMRVDGAPFRLSRIKYIRDAMESIQLNSFSGPCIIISASGMCEHGRIQHHIKNNCTRSENTIMIVGFQAQHTLGRRIVEKQKMIRIFGVEYPLRAEVEIVNAFSCHAGRTDLIDFATEAAASAKRILLVHGESESMDALKSGLAEKGITQVSIPDFGVPIEL